MCGTTESLTRAWRDVSKPFVDTSLGRMAVNVGTAGMSAPAFAAYDISRGADPLRAAAGGALGYFGGQSANNWLTNGGSPLASGMSEQMGDFLPAETGASGVSSVPDLPPSMDIGGGASPFLNSPDTASMWNPGESFSSSISSSPTGLDNYVPLEDTVGASMDTGGLGATKGNPSWLSRVGTSASRSMGEAWSPEGIGRSLGTMGPVAVAGGLFDMFAKGDQAKAQRDRFNQIQNQINGMYAPGSPEHSALLQQLSRTDAAAGRNSQVGPRSVDLAAKIAALKGNLMSQTLGQQNTMFNDSLTNGSGGLGSLFASWQKANTPRPSPTYNIYQR